MEKSFQLIRTNPRLTTNIKLVVDSNYNLYFESFDSSKELSNQKYKHYLLNREASIENEVPKFYDSLPKNIAFSPKTQNDTDVMYNEYIQQFDPIYFAGANEVDDQWYKEEFEYFAPLYVKKGEIPKKFIILRVDEPSIYKLVGDDYVIGELNKDNFRTEIIDKWKCISVFNLSNSTNVGKFFDRNINNNKRFPDFSFFFDIKSYNYSKWDGLEYETGVYKISEMFLDDKTYYENNHFNLEEFITKGFEDNGLLFPYIFNMKFLFDDSPATPDEFKKWSMNRYYGFYAEDFELVKTITSADLVELKSDLIIKNNIFLNSTGGYVNPYVLGFTDNKWIQVDNDFYEVKLQSNGSFKIIADRNLTGYNVSSINASSYNIVNNYIGQLDIDKFIATDGTISDMYADIYLIEILGNYHIIKQDTNGNHFIQTDYNINSNNKSLQYYKGGKNNEFSGQTSVTKTDGSLLFYSIYRVKLTDIKDFDFDRINTHYADFDYEKSEYVDTPEVKLYANEYRDSSIPMRKKTHDKGEDGQYKLKNISSEYSANDETFELINKRITPIFEKNQSVCKWGYSGSISHSDYPYKLNNNLKNGGLYNRTTNTSLKVANIKEKTLDYFYRIGELYGKDVNDFATGFTTNSSIDWTFSGTAAHIWNSNSLAINAIGGKIGIVEYNYPIISNKLYSIDMTFSLGGGPGGSYEVGIDSNSFLSGTTTEISNTRISFIGLSQSTSFKIFVNDGLVNIYTVKLTELVNKYYFNQSTNIQTKLHKKFDVNNDAFNLNHYINSEFDYFDFFFKNNMYYENSGKNYKKPYLKYSVFGGGDNDLPATTLFKGIEYKLYNVEDMVLNTPEGTLETIRNIITQGGQNFNGYKFSVILSENYKKYNFKKIGDIYNYPKELQTENTSIQGIDMLQNSNSDGIHIFLNDKFKNVLIIINKIIPINNEWGTLNNVDMFGENHGLYYGKTLDNLYSILPITGITSYDPNTLSASYFMDSINNLNIKNVYEKYINYYYIDKDSNFAQTEMINFNDGVNKFSNLSNWSNKFPLFYIETGESNNLILKKNSYTTTPIKGPETNIYDKYLVYNNDIPLNESYIDEPLSRKIEKYEVDQTIKSISHGEKLYNNKIINRFVGYYEPIFKNLNIFKPTYYYLSGDTYNSITGNYVFGDDLDQFGMVEELMYSKVNEYNNYLKLKNSDTERSYYPMVDEIGLSQTSRFIFLSSWDRNFYIKTINEQTLLANYVAIPTQIITSPTYATITNSTFGKNPSATNLSNGVKLYGKTLSGDDKLSYAVTIKNNSSEPKQFKIRMYLKYNTTTESSIDFGTTSLIQPNSTYIHTFTPQSRPLELNIGTFEEYTTYYVYFKCLDMSDVQLDDKSFNNFKIYNDLIKFVASSPSLELGTIGPHYTGQQYDFSIKIKNDPNYNKLTETSVGSMLLIKSNTLIYITGKTNTGTDKIYKNQNTEIFFNNVLLNMSALGLTYNQILSTDVRYYVYHNYIIEGTTMITGVTYDISSYNITGESQPTNLIWYDSPTPAISKVAGTCNLRSNIYSGDIFTLSNTHIKNMGGTFTGTITYIATLYQDNVPMSVSTTWTENATIIQNGIQPPSNSTQRFLGPYYNDGTTPLVTLTTSNYKIVVTATATGGLTVSGGPEQTPTTIGTQTSLYPCIPLSVDLTTVDFLWSGVAINGDGIKHYINVTCPNGVTWTVGENSIWVKIFFGTGSGNGSFYMTAEQNNTGRSRYTVVTVSAPGKTDVTISVNQIPQAI